VIVGLDEQVTKQRLAVDQVALLVIAAIQLKKIEAPGAQIARGAFHERFEVRLAVAVTDNNLGIDDGRARRQAQEAIADGGKPARVVVAVATEDHHLIAMLVQLGTPAVELDLVQPAMAGRRLLLQDRGGRDDEWATLQHPADVGFDGCLGKSLSLGHHSDSTGRFGEVNVREPRGRNVALRGDPMSTVDTRRTTSTALIILLVASWIFFLFATGAVIAGLLI